MSKLIIIDGNSLLFRAYYATAFGGTETIMRTKDGVPTNAIFAFSNMINKIVSSLKEGEAIFVAFDTGHQTFRHEALDCYKANRKPAPQELITQFPLAREFLDAMGIYQFEQDGFEGDDIAGTIAKMAEKDGYDVFIYTSDRDFLQLVTPKISINVIKKGLSDVMVMTPESVKETYGFEPLQIIDYKGLRGDSSDNLPGIPGVGEKTAVKLIQEYGSFDNIIANAPNMKGKIKDTLLENQEIGRISRDLAIIKTDITLPFGVEDTIYKGYDFQKINDFCQKLELKSFMNKVSTKWKKASLSDELTILELKTLDSEPLPDEVGIYIDLDGDDYSYSKVLGIAFNMNQKHIYMNIEDVKNSKKALEILENPNIKKFAYDYKAIKVALNREGIKINGLFFDILIASYLIDTSLKNDPSSIMRFYGLDLHQTKDEGLFAEVDNQRSCQIAYFSHLLYPRVKHELEKIDALSLFNDLELPLVDTLADMEIEGFPLDKTILDEFGDVFKQKEKELSKTIYELAGRQFNLASPKQMGEILFDVLGLPNYKKGSTSIEVLKDLEKYHPIIPLIIEHRKYAKLISTYIEGLKPHIHSDGKIHAKFNQALTQTGRLSSSEPNLQNISIRDEEGKMIRKAFKYPTDDYCILSLDYSQIELRILASLTKAQGLIEIFKSKEDIHSATAKKVFNLESEPTENQRRKAKAVNFGIVYGISDWGLSEQIGVSLKEAKEIISSFYKSFPEVSIFFNELIRNAMENGYVTTKLGRRRYLRGLHDANYQVREFEKRAAMNAPVQGSAADLIKIAMVKVDQKLKENNLESKMVLQIHDELIFKVKKEEKDIVFNLVKKEMETALDIGIDLEVDGGFGDDWYSAK